MPAVAFAAAPELNSTTLLSDGNLVLYYRLESNSNDSSSSGNNGTDTGMSYGSGNGKFNNGAAFDGLTSNITTANNSITGTGAFTLHAWVKTSISAGFGRRLYTTGDLSGTGTEMEWYMNSNGTVSMDGNGDGGPTSAGTINDNVFHMVEVVYDGAGSAQLYIDGASSGSSASVSLNLASATTHWIGQDFGKFAGTTWSGSIDDFAIFTRALTATEISNLFNGFPVVQTQFIIIS